MPSPKFKPSRVMTTATNFSSPPLFHHFHPKPSFLFSFFVSSLIFLSSFSLFPACQPSLSFLPIASLFLSLSLLLIPLFFFSSLSSSVFPPSSLFPCSPSLMAHAPSCFCARGVKPLLFVHFS